MSIFGEDKINIPVYYCLRDSKYGSKKLIVLSDAKAKKMLDNPVEKDQVKILNTQWKTLSWKESNDLYTRSVIVNPTTGKNDFDWATYQDMRIKRCLVGWDLMQGSQPVPIDPGTIDKMHVDIVRDLLNKYDEITSVSDEEMEK